MESEVFICHIYKEEKKKKYKNIMIFSHFIRGKKRVDISE
jgi:hypothetical protein